VFDFPVANTGPVLFYSAEERRDELHRRLDATIKHEGKTFADLKQLHIICNHGRNTALTVTKEDVVATTPAFAELVKTIRTLRPTLVWIDAVAQLLSEMRMIDRFSYRIPAPCASWLIYAAAW
jgi:RecA-family ATPase